MAYNHSIKAFFILLIVSSITHSIYVPGEDTQRKPSFTPGIKTTFYKQKIQLHHNYSKVSTNQNHLTNTEDSESTTIKIYPVFNGHTYDQNPNQKPDQKSNQSNENPRPIFKRKTELIEVYSKCPPKATGQFVYAMSCNQYLNCWKGRGTIQNCAAGTLFNPKTLSCDFPNKVECITGPKYNSIRQRSISQAKSFDPLMSHDGVGGGRQISCPEGFSGLIPNYTDCSKFINCNQGQQFSMDCPAGTLFNINLNVCDFPYKTTCFNGVKGYEKVKYSNYYKDNDYEQFPSSNYDGNKKSAHLKTNLDHHQSYYDHNDRSSKSSDVYPSQTNNFYQTNYGSQNNQYGKDSKLDLTANGCQVKGQCNQDQGIKCPIGFQGFYRHPNNCSKYLSCFDKSTKIESCLQGTRFNPMTGKCDRADIVNCQTAIKGYQIFPDNNQQGSGQNYHSSYGRTFNHDSSNRQFYTTNYHGNGGNYQQYETENPGNGYDQRVDSNYHKISGYQQNRNFGNGYQSSLDSNRGVLNGFGNGDQLTSESSTYSNKNYQNGGKNYGIICNINDRNCNRNLNIGSHQQSSNNFDNLHQQTSSNFETHHQSLSNLNPHQQTSSNYGTPDHQTSTNFGTHQQSSSNFYNHNNKNSGSMIKCPDNYNGLKKHPTDCAKFLNCANGQTFIQDCAPGTLFNPNLGNCDFPYKVKCENSKSNQNLHNDNKNIHSGYGGNTQENYQGNYQGIYPGSDQEIHQGNYQQIHRSSSEKPETIPIYSTYNPQGSGSNTDGYNGQSRGNDGQYQYNPNPGINKNNYNNNYGSTNNQQENIYRNHPNQQSMNGYQQPHDYHQESTQTSPQNLNTDQLLTSQSQTWKQVLPYNGNQNQGLPNKTGLLNVQIITPECGRGGSCITSFTTRRSSPITHTPKPNLRQPFLDQSWSSVRHTASWPPPFPKADPNADYILEYDDDVEEVSNDIELVAENKNFHQSKFKCSNSKDSFYCDSKNCIPKFWVCNGKRDCVNGNDEKDCGKYLNKFEVFKDSRLAVEEQQRWDNVSFATCAMLCLESQKIHCRSFNYRKIDKTCFLTDTNIGMSGMLIAYYPCDYYELRSSTLDCTGRHRCPNNKCIKKSQLCDGQNDCGDRSDEKNCKAEDFGYKIRLTGSNNSYEGRIELTAFDRTGYICDDKFSILDAAVVCKELGFPLGALDIKGNSHFAKDLKENNTFYLMDDLTCTGNESTILDCDFNGWGVHDCGNKEIAGVVCKTTQEKCDEDFWKCDTGNECIPIPFVCDGLNDCIDDSDEAVHHCESPTVVRLANGSAPNRGRVEIRHNSIWGTVCDDDFNEDAAKVVCQYLGYKGHAVVVKDGYFGSGEGPIWLDQVRCFGNESTLDQCTHWNWGEHNCDHAEDVGVICSNDKKPSRDDYNVIKPKKMSESLPILPNTCGYRKDNMFLKKDDIHMRVVSGSKATPGDYPWQVSIRVNRGKKPSHWCGAVIISNKWVLTAAHCLSGYAKGVYILTAGDYNVDEDEGTEQNVFIDEFFIHEKYQKGHQMNNDIALIKLKGNGFNLNQDVQPICLPEDDVSYEDGLNCTISGFGSTKSGSKVSSRMLMAAWIPMQKPEICKMPHIYGDNIQEGMFCAGSLEEGADSCDGDSGGPLACLNNGLFTLYGITSWGHHCGYANKPGVYVKVAFYRSWIDEIMNKYS